MFDIDAEELALSISSDETITNIALDFYERKLMGEEYCNRREPLWNLSYDEKVARIKAFSNVKSEKDLLNKSTHKLHSAMGRCADETKDIISNIISDQGFSAKKTADYLDKVFNGKSCMMTELTNGVLDGELLEVTIFCDIKYKVREV